MQKIFAPFFNRKESDFFLFSKGRVALYALLKAIGVGADDEVICSGYTCVMVPSAPRFLGAKCRYIDINPNTYNIDTKLLDASYTNKVKALIIQHTYGIAQNMDMVQEWAVSKNIPIIEDCCHSFGSKWKGKLCGSFGIGSFFSGQWNKPFSSGLGGILMINNDEVLAEVKSLYQSTSSPSLIEEKRIAFQIMAYGMLVNPRSVSIITKLYRLLSAIGLAIGSSTNEELSGDMPKDYFKKMANAQIKEGIRNLANIDASISHRRGISEIYSAELSRLSFAPLIEENDAQNVLLRYPVRVANKDELLAKALRHGIEIGSWFEIPLHPSGTDMEKFGYSVGMCPESERACKEVVNLPTHDKITEKEAKRILSFMDRFARRVTK